MAETFISPSNRRAAPAPIARLTGLDNAAVILPTDGRSPVIISDQETGNDWIREFRPVEHSWGASMARALLDAGMERGRIGVSGIQRGFYTHGQRAFHGVAESQFLR